MVTGRYLGIPEKDFAFAKFEIIELPDESIKHSGNAESVKNKAAIYYPEIYQTWGLCCLISLSERKNVVFITGGVFGVDKSIWQRANNVLALSRLTFTHRLVRLILCEQIRPKHVVCHVCLGSKSRTRTLKTALPYVRLDWRRMLFFQRLLYCWRSQLFSWFSFNVISILVQQCC